MSPNPYRKEASPLLTVAEELRRRADERHAEDRAYALRAMLPEALAECRTAADEGETSVVIAPRWKTVTPRRWWWARVEEGQGTEAMVETLERALADRGFKVRRRESYRVEIEVRW